MALDLTPLLVSEASRVQLPLQHTPLATCLSTNCHRTGGPGGVPHIHHPIPLMSSSGTKKGRAVGRLRPSEWRYGPLWTSLSTSSPGSSALLPLLSPARSRRRR